jgi:hypothetical protein
MNDTIKKHIKAYRYHLFVLFAALMYHKIIECASTKVLHSISSPQVCKTGLCQDPTVYPYATQKEQSADVSGWKYCCKHGKPSYRCPVEKKEFLS